jgi:hypothetical protein
MGKHQHIKKILFAGIIVFLFVFRIQGKFKIFEKGYLNGYYVNTAAPELTVDGWFSADYQAKKQLYIEENIGFRNYLIRLNNQFAYSIFGVARANGVVIGKEKYLFEEQYIRSYLGTDFVGEEVIAEKVKKLEFVTQQLKLEGIDLINVIAPGKGFYYPEYIPNSRLREKQDTTNYERYLNALQQKNLLTIDVNGWFLKMKDTATYPLYPKGGTHWSHYGEMIVADSISRFIADVRNTPLPKIVIESVEWSDTSRYADNDIELGMNLLFHLKPNRMAYPKFWFDKTGVDQKTRVLTIGDSYYWGMYGHEVTDYVFSNSQFWYYNNLVYQPGFDERKLSDMNKMNELRTHQVVMLLFTEGNLPHFAYGFIDDLYEYYTNHPITDRELRLVAAKKSILNNPDWLQLVKEDAVKKGVTLEENIQAHAEYMLFKEESKQLEQQ